MSIDLSRLIDALPGLVWTTLPDGRADFLNRRWCEYTGLTEEEALGAGWQVAVHPVDRPVLVDYWNSLIELGETGEVEARLRRHDGEYRRFLFSAAPIRDESGIIQRWCGINTDIEERWRTEYLQAMRQITEAQSLSRTGSFTADVWADEHNWSDELYRIFEIDPETRISVAQIQALILPEDRERFGAEFAKAVEQRIRYDQTFRIVTPSGKPKHLHAVAQYSGEIAGRPLYMGAIQDITNRRLAEAALEASEAELRRINSLLTEAERVSGTGSFMADLVHDRSIWSEELYRLFGIEPREFIETDDVLRLTHPLDRQIVDNAIESAKKGAETIDFSFRILPAKGEVRYLRCVARANEEIAAGPVFVGAIQDLTSLKVAEESLDRARAELAHLARLTALSTLTASIAHEVNQPLSGIITNASTCLRMLAANPPDIEAARATAERTIRDGGRASEIIQRLRQMFTRKQWKVERFDMAAAVEEVLALAAGELRRTAIKVHRESSGDLPVVSGDKVQLQQVAMNLVLNAADAMREVDGSRRELHVTTSCETPHEVIVEVRDSGSGIADDALGNLFDPFFTTKAEGMGIGLAISRSIVERHGGRLWAANNANDGATFAFAIPVDRDANEPQPSKIDDLPARRWKGPSDGA